MFIKRMVSQLIIVCGIAIAGILMILIKDVDISCIIGGMISAIGLAYGYIKFQFEAFILTTARSVEKKYKNTKDGFIV